MSTGRYLFFIFAITPLYSISQVSYENQGWFSLTAEKSLNSSTKSAIQFESRVDFNSGIVVNNFANISVEKDISERFSTEFHYRYLVRNEGEQMLSDAHRLMLDLSYKIPLKKTDVVLRLRTGREDESSAEGGFFNFDEVVLRQKLSVKHGFGKTNITVSAEQFETITASEFDFDQLRLVLTSEFKLSKRHSVSCFLMYQNLISVKRLNIGSGYIYKFKGRKTVKKDLN